MRENWNRLTLDQALSPERISWVALTPSFPASGHVIFLGLSERSLAPSLVLKVSRLPGEDGSLKREAANLVRVHSARDGGFDSIPRVLDFGYVGGYSVLLESALVGAHMNRGFVRKQREWCIEAVLKWVIELHSASAIRSTEAGNWFSRLVDAPLARLSSLPLSRDERNLLERASSIVAPLRGKEFPLVFSHGDLSDPNILVLQQGGIGVVDWETAEPESMPGADIFFFLKFVSTALYSSGENGHLAVFRRTFCSPDSWCRDYLARYAQAMKLDRELLTPLFVLCYTRYLSELALRLGGNAEVPGSEIIACMRSEPVYHWWRAGIEYADQLCLS